MIVDDEPDLVDIVKKILNSENYKTMQAYGGKECLEKIRKEKPDLILLDIMMRPMDGWETLELIKKDENLKDIPVSMLTVIALTPEIMRKRDIENIENYIVKPFSKKELLLKVREILEETEQIKNEFISVKKKKGREIAKDLEDLRKKIERHTKLMAVLKKHSSKSGISDTKSMLALENRRIKQWEMKLKEIKEELGL